MIGKTVAHYQIIDKLGQGGMGEVFLAHDTSLDRRVALKFLPLEMQRDTFAHKRFLREAKSAAALDHAYICHIHEVAEAEGTCFIVMEYVEGQTLNSRLAKGPLPQREALRTAAEIAEALEHAHEKGIIHRDVKPSNIMLTPKGHGKVMDFGLAKQAKRIEEAVSREDTLTALTKEGMTVGTLAYMSPEQLRGQPVDARSDIFSFGMLLYEMLTGVHPFRKASPMDTASAILSTSQPPLSEYIPNPPVVLEYLLKRMLAKEVNRRFQHMDEVRIALEDVKAALEQPEKPSQERRKPSVRRHRAALAVVASVALAIAVYLGWRNISLSSTGGAMYLFEQVTDEPGQEMNPSLSPDGRSLVYASRSAGNWDIYLLRVGGKNPVNLTKNCTDDDTQPVFSPDGERVAFRSEREGGGIFLMGATGESVRRLTDFCYLPAWSPDGKEIACSTVSPYRPDVREASSSQIFVVEVESGKYRLVSPGILDAVQPSWSPDGRRITFWGVREGQCDIFTVAREGGDVASITNGEAFNWNPVWSPDGKYIYFSSNRGGAMNLWRVTVSAESGRRTGHLEPISVPSTYAASISFSRDGRRLAYSNCQRSSNICRIDFDAARESVIGAPRAVTRGIKETLYPSISRDGSWIAFTLLGLHEDLALIRLDGSDMRRITEGTAVNRQPRWSPDGGELAFMSTRSGHFEICTIRPDGSGFKQVTEDSPRGGVSYPSWSPDGHRLSYNLPDEMGYIVENGRPWHEQQPELARGELPDHCWLWLNDWSHDGAKIAGTLQKLDGGTLGIGAYNTKTQKIERYTIFGQLPRWLPDGRRFLFHARDRIFLADSTGGRTKEILSTKEGTINPYFDVSWDGREIVFSLESMESDVWIMTAGPNK